jgi:hypothetical protein
MRRGLAFAAAIVNAHGPEFVGILWEMGAGQFDD